MRSHLKLVARGWHPAAARSGVAVAHLNLAISDIGCVLVEQLQHRQGSAISELRALTDAIGAVRDRFRCLARELEHGETADTQQATEWSRLPAASYPSSPVRVAAVSRIGSALMTAARHIELSIAHMNNVAQGGIPVSPDGIRAAIVGEITLLVRALADIRDHLRELDASR